MALVVALALLVAVLPLVSACPAPTPTPTPTATPRPTPTPTLTPLQTGVGVYDESDKVFEHLLALAKSPLAKQYLAEIVGYELGTRTEVQVRYDKEGKPHEGWRVLVHFDQWGSPAGYAKHPHWRDSWWWVERSDGSIRFDSADAMWIEAEIEILNAGQK